VHGEDTADGPLYRIFGSRGPAGLLMHSKGLPSELDDTYRYILISSVSSKLLVDSVDDHVLVLEEGYETEGAADVVISRYSAWRSLACIMLIKATEQGYSERIAVGQIHIEAWSDANPVYEKIYLG
jgi:hypothetical protein